MARLNDPRFNIKLVKVIRKHPCLYNYKLPEYSRKDISEQAWTDVSKQVNEPVSVCKEKWKNIRTVFVRHLKTGTTSSTPPSKLKQMKQRRPYYLKNLMQFIVPFIKCNPPSIDTVDAMEHEPTDQIEETFEIKTEHEDYESSGSNENYQNIEFNKNDTDCINCQKNKTELDESRKLFLLSLLPELNQMNDQQMKRFKRNVLVLIDDILEENNQNTSKYLEYSYNT